MSAKRIVLEPDAVRDLGPWRVPPENQGQMVEVSYTGDEEYVYERSFDRSPRTTSFRRRPWRQDDEVHIGLNAVPKGFDRVRRSRRAASARANPPAAGVKYLVVQAHNDGILSRHRTLAAARRGLAKAERNLARWKNAAHGGNRNARVRVEIRDLRGQVVS